MLENITHFIFDFDGTLVDSMPMWDSIHALVFEKLNLPFNKEKYFHDIQGLLPTEVCQFIASSYNISSWEVINDMFDSLILEQLEHVEFIPFAEEFLNKLVEKNINFGIASVCKKPFILHYLKKYPLILQNVTVVSCNEVGVSKPDPAVFIECMKRIGGNVDNSIIFEDTLTGMKGGRASGMKLIGVLSDIGYKEEKTAICDFTIDDYREIINEIM